MKMSVTFEHEDLLKFITDMLAVKGLKPLDTPRFNEQPEKVDAAIGPRYSVSVNCEAGELAEQCPMCGHGQNGPSVREQLDAALAQPATEPETKDVPDHMALGSEGERVEEPMDHVETDDVDDVDDDDGPPMSLSALTATNERLIRERERARSKQPSQPALMPGESSEPPKF